ncbi:YwdI family protein [Listeria grandensis]|uniref:YwdI family protein n=1 Tax=Listeria grandensis TaxID=1494963 RepID=A0A7X0Y5S8_9LIST|nr:YwdI family protein [Listeria grandensis]MBC1475213.1 YwdI family protein [Listeria grandensis]MBC1937054.1 YwdI family protein [Listeria grandensis]
MTVSDQALFAKMEQELSLAKNASKEQEKQLHLHGLAVLVEVMRGQAGTTEKTETLSSSMEYQAMTGELPIAKPMTLDSKKMETEDGSNGDSLLDF